MSRAHWVGLTLAAGYLIPEVISFVVIQRIWRASPSGLMFWEFRRTAGRINFRRNFGLDDLHDPAIRDVPGLYDARRCCFALGYAQVSALILVLAGSAYFE